MPSQNRLDCRMDFPASHSLQQARHRVFPDLRKILILPSLETPLGLRIEKWPAFQAARDARTAKAWASIGRETIFDFGKAGCRADHSPCDPEVGPPPQKKDRSRDPPRLLLSRPPSDRSRPSRRLHLPPPSLCAPQRQVVDPRQVRARLVCLSRRTTAGKFPAAAVGCRWAADQYLQRTFPPHLGPCIRNYCA